MAADAGDVRRRRLVLLRRLAMLTAFFHPDHQVRRTAHATFRDLLAVVTRWRRW
ncbi:hypothetical protein HUO13_06915 [Saccharopolyspora erythraea]|uniref:hypothetical protein n=1 Tax=Saccharopolyspora erythraea TaxID=1836 RepID=UPI001BAB0F18|nr:hypothetical protein [Saccharopolyspora erythraea]QUH00586.1 hypothetical protein HUO13_06915 [Saccharopolyspora erythraea]